MKKTAGKPNVVMVKCCKWSKSTGNLIERQEQPVYTVIYTKSEGRSIETGGKINKLFSVVITVTSGRHLYVNVL